MGVFSRNRRLRSFKGRREGGGGTDPYPSTISDQPTQPHVIAMVGLPARGKSFISKKLAAHLNESGIRTKVFNLGEYRRRLLAKEREKFQNPDFFGSDNKEGMAVRNRCAQDALNDVANWLKNEGGQVAVFDGTNSTMERRKMIHTFVVEEMGFNLMFIESVCDDPEIIEKNILDAKVKSPDYLGRDMDKENIVTDFLQRIQHYEDQYETLDVKNRNKEEGRYSYVKIFNKGENIALHKIGAGGIHSTVVKYLVKTYDMERGVAVVEIEQPQPPRRILEEREDHHNHRHPHLHFPFSRRILNSENRTGMMEGWMGRTIH